MAWSCTNLEVVGSRGRPPTLSSGRLLTHDTHLNSSDVIHEIDDMDDSSVYKYSRAPS